MLLPHSYQYLTFDDQLTLDFARDDPVGFVSQLPQHVILDEVQLVPGIFRSIKYSIDQNRIPGRFLLTGSAQVSRLKELADSLVGRVDVLELHPLAQCEVEPTFQVESRGADRIAEVPEDFDGNFRSLFLPRILNMTLMNEPTQEIRLGRDLAGVITLGGFPIPRKLGHIDRLRWFKEYVRTITNRDLRSLSSIRKPDIVPRLVEVISSQTSSLFNVSNLARSIGIIQSTLSEYVGLLEDLYLVNRLPAWSHHRLSRVTKQPKIFAADTGLACAFLNENDSSLWNDRKLFGHMVETFVVNELIKQASWLEESLSFYHYRDRDRHEIDLVIELAGGGVIAIEIKARATVQDSDFRSVRKLRQLHSNFIAGIVLYDGVWTREFDQNLFAVPISKIFEFELVN